MTIIFIDDPELGGPTWPPTVPRETDEFHLRGTEHDHDQQTHGGAGVGGDRSDGARNDQRPGSRAALNGTNEPLPTLPSAPLDLGEIQAVETYMGVGIVINSQLRKDTVTPGNSGVVERLDSAFDHSPGFTEDTVVYRLVPRELTTHPKGPGWGDPPPITDAGYLSTTYNKQQLPAISQTLGYEQTHVEIKIVIPAGTPALHVSDSRFQNEILLPRGGTLTPTDRLDEWRFTV